MPNKGSATYSKGYIKKLYSSGLAAQLTFGTNNQNEKAVKKVKLHQQIATEIENNINLVNNEIEFDTDGALLELFKLLCFIHAWSDSPEIWDKVDNIERKKIRELFKFKRKIPKPIRRSIHYGLYKLTLESLQRFKQIAENDEEKKLIEQLLNCLKKIYQDDDIDSDLKKKSLIIIIYRFLEQKEFNAPIKIDEIFSDATQLISDFSIWSDKLLKGCGFSIALIAALACGLSTGAAIFILLVSFSLPLGFVIPLSILFFIAGTRANFQLLSQHISGFFQDLFKEGGITKFIDQQGKYDQLSRNKKFLLLPAGFLSLSVGIAAAAITYLEGAKMLALICPMLATTCPHLTAAILGILAAALLIGLTIVMLRTFIGLLQSQFSWQDFKKDLQQKWQTITFAQILVYIFKILVMAAAFFGLAYLDFTGTVTLANLLGWVAADIITIAAIIGDLPFTLKTALAWCNSLFSKNDSDSNLTKDTKYYLGKLVEFLALIINALGNAALVFTDSCTSRIASIACFMNSYASNRIEEDEGELIQLREEVTQKSLDSLCGFFKPACLDTQISEASNESAGIYLARSL